MLDLKCTNCGLSYQKPKDFKKWNNERPNVFYRWSLAYCDACRKQKEVKALNRLPDIIKALSNNT